MRHSNHSFVPNLESLEVRIVPSTMRSGDTLKISGTGYDDVVQVKQYRSRGKDFVRVIEWTKNEEGYISYQTSRHSLKGIEQIEFHGYAGNDGFSYTVPSSQISKAVRVVAYGGAGRDTLSGGPKADELYGEDNRDILKGHGGDDILIGGDGNDDLWGNKGNDFLAGGAGVDYMNGGADDDVLQSWGDQEKDTVYGFTGWDTFYADGHFINIGGKPNAIFFDNVVDYDSETREGLDLLPVGLSDFFNDLGKKRPR